VARYKTLKIAIRYRRNDCVITAFNHLVSPLLIDHR
jgi:hypothetical protein